MRGRWSYRKGEPTRPSQLTDGNGVALDPAGVEVRCIVTKVVRMEEVIFDGEVPINASACVPVPVPTDETAEFLVEYHVRLPDHTTLALEPQRAVVQDEL